MFNPQSITANVPENLPQGKLLIQTFFSFRILIIQTCQRLFNCYSVLGQHLYNWNNREKNELF